MTNELDMLAVTNCVLATEARPGEREDAGPLETSAPLRSVVLVCGRAKAPSLDALLVATSDYDVIFVESIANSYSCIKRVVPDLVIISSEIDGAAACQLLSVLTTDRRSARIPVLTSPKFREQDDLDCDLPELNHATSTQSLAAPMN